MTHTTHLELEVMVPRDVEVRGRLLDFYAEIGCDIRPADTSPDDLWVWWRDEDDEPLYSYWLTENTRKIGRFAVNETPEPSGYSVGLALPAYGQPGFDDLKEVCLMMPNEKAVSDVHRRGGQLLAAHTIVPLQSHAGRIHFWFVDPLNHPFRVTTPGNKPTRRQD